MKFKPFNNKYSFPDNELIADFPNYLRDPIEDWLLRILTNAGVVKTINHYMSRGQKYLVSAFINNLQIIFRERFPRDWSEMMEFIFQNRDRTANFLAFCLQNYADAADAVQLEYILSKGGSIYTVVKTDKDASNYKKGVYDLVERISPVIKKQSRRAITDNEILMEAWLFCYSRAPDYEKVVSRCCDFLEGYLGKKYFPKDPKPQLKKFIHLLEDAPEKLIYKGSTIVKPKSLLLSLLREASNIRGQHTLGKGRKPTKEEAEFVLHVTILIWNLHQK